MANFNCSKLYYRSVNNRHTDWASNGCIHNNTGTEHKYYGLGLLTLLRNEKGSVDFLIAFALLTFLVFICVDFFTLFANYQVSKHVSYYYLERVRIEGCLTNSDETDMMAKYTSVNMTVEDISCVNGLNNARISTGGTSVLKDPESADNSKIEMKITVKPGVKPLLSATLIGASPVGNDFRLKVGGVVLSEKV